MGCYGVPPWTVERGRRNDVVACFPWPIGVLGCLRWLGGRSVRWAASVATEEAHCGGQEKLLKTAMGLRESSPEEREDSEPEIVRRP
ncbi:hypothetical protein OIU76_000058 [Salix suchowensis]|nr:hypothetical protein OIU76_000058 [Salix suchowensis]